MALVGLPAGFQGRGLILLLARAGMEIAGVGSFLRFQGRRG
jgi:hypothetical protein